MSLRGAQRRSNLMKYNEIATPRPLQFLMVRARNDKKGFGQHAFEIQQADPESLFKDVNVFLRADILEDLRPHSHTDFTQMSCSQQIHIGP